MPAKVIDVTQARAGGDLRDVVHHAVQALAEGHVVAFPTETVYGLAAAALNEKAVAKLSEIKGRKSGHPFTLAVKSLEDAYDFVPNMSPVAQRLGRRCWPGPLTLVLDEDHADSLAKRLPTSVRQAVCPQGTLGLRVPAAPLIIDVMRLLAGPLALTSANRTGNAEPVTGDEVLAEVGNDVRLLLNDGRCQFGQPSSVVRVSGHQLKILRQGVISATNLRRLSSLFVLLVCTGNTCRSPMAAGLLRRMLAQRLGCTDEEVENRGVIVASAGIAAAPGGRASAEAIDIMHARGIELVDHVSQPLRDPLVRHADLILTLTNGHRQAVLAQWPEAASRTHVLSLEGDDVSDPIGGPTEMYERCARQIDTLLQARLEQLDLTAIEVIEA